MIETGGMSPIGQYDGGASLTSPNLSPRFVVNPVVDIPPELAPPSLFTIGSGDPNLEAPVAPVRYEAGVLDVEVNERHAGKKTRKKRGRKPGKKAESGDKEDLVP